MIGSRRSVVLLAIAGAAMVALVAACGNATPSRFLTSIAQTPTPTPTTRISTPTSAPGVRLPFEAAGCGVCHGEDAEGSAIAPALAGHSAVQVRRQVRTPRDTMPAFSVEALSDDDLGEIIEFIERLVPLGEGHLHVYEPSQSVSAHLLMGLIALKGGNKADSVHHIEHARLVADADVAATLDEILEAVEAGELHDAEHELEELLPATPDSSVPDEETLHLQLALDALADDDDDDAAHRLEHYLDLPPGEGFETAQEALSLVLEGDVHEAEDEVQEILGLAHE